MTTITPSARPEVQDGGRREFLKSSTLLTGMLAAQSVLGLLAPTLCWALEVHNLSQPEAEGVLALAKTLYPHKDLPDAVYALVVKDIDDYAAAADAHSGVTAGVHALNAKAGGHFAKASAAKRRKAVEALIDQPFVQKVRGTCITGLYDNEMAYAHFGYEGEAFSKGGYVHRGFNDLAWLPAPPADASPVPAA